MIKRIPGALISLLAVEGLFLSVASLPAAGPAGPKPEAFLFSFFRDNGQDGLFLAWSRDGLRWSELKPPGKSFLAPTLGGKLIFWSSTIPGRFAETAGSGDDGWNHRPYYVTTRDFETFSETKLLYDGGFNVIDATLVKVGPRYHLIVKDETRQPVKKHLRFAASDQAEGPFGPASEPFTIAWVEGPSALMIGAEVLVYFDHYATPQYYGAVRTSDFKTWQDLTKEVSFPAGARHGTVLPIGAAVLDRLR